MNSDVAIEIKNVSKSFRIEIEDKEKQGGLFSKRTTKIIENKVLDNISLSIKKGEILGIVGRNGSGKSTFLSLLSKIHSPDQGTIEINGKLATILELGMGFHPDMSGRENIYLKGELYGFSKKQIDDRIDKIIHYSGIEKFIDNPVRTYSSGMSARLAFAIMVNVDSEILVVDEVLSVGDSSFEVKAREHFKRLAKTGKTILFVSHQISFMEQLCSRVIWLENGKIIKDGNPKTVCSEYLNKINESLEIISDLAESGVSDSQYKLAIMYRDGSKVNQNQELYLKWIKEASDGGHTLSQVEYANYLFSLNDEKYREEIKSLYQIAANKGNSEARLKLSLIDNSKGWISDRNEILNIFEQLANKGNPQNIHRYADLLLKTAWNISDRKKAFEWFLKSADNGNLDSCFQVAVMYRDAIGVPKSIDKTLEYLKKASDGGMVRAQTLLADIYHEGRLVPKNDTIAYEYYLKSANLGVTKSQYQVAIMLKEGLGTEIDLNASNHWFEVYSKSILTMHQLWAAEVLKYTKLETDATTQSLYEKAASTHNNTAIMQLALFNRDGVWITPNIEKAIYWYERGAELYSGSKLALADLYYRGILVPQDYEKAMGLYKQCLNLGDPTAAYRLGCMYRDGLGVNSDFNQAKKYFEYAEEKGFRESLAILNKCKN